MMPYTIATGSGSKLLILNDFLGDLIGGVERGFIAVDDNEDRDTGGS